MISNLQASRVWVERNPRFELESLIEIKCLDSSNCYLLSDNALNWRLYHSSNQGKTWNLMSEYEQFLKGEWVNARHLYLVNSKNIIIAFADRFLIMKSEDGGETFREISYGDLSEVFNSSRGIDMIDNIGIIATYDFFAYTNDNWETIDTIIRPSFGESYKLPGGNIYFIDSTQFICNRWANRSADFVVYDIEKKNGNNTVTFYMRILIVVITPEGCMISKL